MQHGEISTPAIERLSASELEILRLLASGHTAKSIALRLGRTEAAINERLRDARRKTGFGSSRELARMLAARKIWDRKIDLPGRGPDSDDKAAPHSARRLTVKGVLMMSIAASLFAAALFALAPSGGLPVHGQGTIVDADGAAGSADASPLVGRWTLDTARVPAEERPRSVAIEFSTDAALSWTMAVDMTTADGTRMRSTATGPADGKPVAISGSMPFIDSVSFRRPAAGTLVVTLGKDGKTVSTRVYAISRDRRTMTETIVWPNQALPQLETNVYERSAS